MPDQKRKVPDVTDANDPDNTDESTLRKRLKTAREELSALQKEVKKQKDEVQEMKQCRIITEGRTDVPVGEAIRMGTRRYVWASVKVVNKKDWRAWCPASDLFKEDALPVLDRYNNRGSASEEKADASSASEAKADAKEPTTGGHD